MHNSTDNLQRLSAFKAATGLVHSLHVWENVLDYKVTDEMAVLKVEVWRFVDTSREVRFNEHGTRLFCWARHETLGWVRAMDPVTIWDEDFQPFIHVKFGRSVSPREHAEQRAWEKSVYRPGTDRFPLDNYERVLAGPTTPAMERYW